jgi:hypothetical protein
MVSDIGREAGSVNDLIGGDVQLVHSEGNCSILQGLFDHA